MKRTLAFTAVVASLFASATASADVRLWEESPDDLESWRWLDVDAYVQPGFVHRFEEAGDSGPVLQRARIGLHAQVVSWLLLRIQLEAAPRLGFADAYVDMPFDPRFGARAGSFRVPFLLDHQFDEVDLAFVDRSLYLPFPPDREHLLSLAPRNLGLLLYGIAGDPAPEGVSPALEYGAAVLGGDGRADRMGARDTLTFAARVELHVLGMPRGASFEGDLARNESPRIAVGAGALVTCSQRASFDRGLTADVELRYRGLHAAASALWIHGSAASDDLGRFLGYDESCTGVLRDPTMPELGALDTVSRGARVQMQYFLPRPLFPVAGQELELRARFDWVDPESPFVAGDPFFGGGPGSPGYVPPDDFAALDQGPTRFRLTFGVSWYPTASQDIRLQLDYQLKREVEDVQAADGVASEIDDDVVWLQLTAGI